MKGQYTLRECRREIRPYKKGLKVLEREHETLEPGSAEEFDNLKRQDDLRSVIAYELRNTNRVMRWILR